MLLTQSYGHTHSKRAKEEEEVSHTYYIQHHRKLFFFLVCCISFYDTAKCRVREEVDHHDSRQFHPSILLIPFLVSTLLSLSLCLWLCLCLCVCWWTLALVRDSNPLYSRRCCCSLVTSKRKEVDGDSRKCSDCHSTLHTHCRVSVERKKKKKRRREASHSHNNITLHPAHCGTR